MAVMIIGLILIGTTITHHIYGTYTTEYKYILSHIVNDIIDDKECILLSSGGAEKLYISAYSNRIAAAKGIVENKSHKYISNRYYAAKELSYIARMLERDEKRIMLIGEYLDNN